MAKLEPATDIDPNVWYHMTEENVDDYDGDFKSMLQTWEDGDFRVFPVAKRKTYWQFCAQQPIGKIPGRYALRCSETTTQKQFAVCYRPSESGKNDTYRFINVHNGSKYHLDVIPSGPVYMSPNLDGYQRRQRWLMTSVSNVDDAAYSTVFSNASRTCRLNHRSLTILRLPMLGVLAIALVAFFLWRRRKRQAEGAPASTQAPPYPQSPDGYKPETSSPTPVYELPNNQNPAELPANH
ncbi:hypothetical protein B0J15DRAFT_510318 [Fusarium solani]|uniref:Uncharacterized protein n=1 Tax=Fusarium solani TaxID=169388 RepID=A0A9P9KU90_FUSSL|nr:uncharacterized protein B0J15DRAFT_510318 [Fusarium solani]KAH7268490.1 hypothetical protein B0J15DRAFT_510318 [Fusarium solani]